MLFSAFNTINKENGFFTKSLFKKGDPEMLTMGPWILYVEGREGGFPGNMVPIKARNANVWIVQRQSAIEAPNLFLSKDLRSFKPITILNPHQKYNWLAAELINYHQLDATPSQGILYKPQDFDPNKKYPIIFNYYEKRSHQLHKFLFPSYIEADMDIPWFVSRGYLVFVPDIYYQDRRAWCAVHLIVWHGAAKVSIKIFLDKYSKNGG